MRAIQLAKAALYAGAKLLIDKRGAGPPRRMTLVGAFGSHIDPLYAMALGLIPDCDLTKVRAGGNAAGTGACIALINLSSRAEIERVVRTIDKVETAIAPNFQDEFVAAMALPHATDASRTSPRRSRCLRRKSPPPGGADAGPRAAPSSLLPLLREKGRG